MAGQSIRYYPTGENRKFLLDVQSQERKKDGPMIGLDGVVDLLLTELRERRAKDQD